MNYMNRLREKRKILNNPLYERRTIKTIKSIYDYVIFFVVVEEEKASEGG